MKHSLGSLLLYLLLYITSHAADFRYAIHADTHNPYLKEPVSLTIDLNQTNHDIVLLFDFDLQKSNAYTFQRIGIEERDAYHALQIRYTYLLYPLHTGEIEVKFKLIQKATTDESIAYSFSGDRDNVKGLVTTNTPVELPPVKLQVKPLPKGTQLVGEFQLDFQLNKDHAEPFEPVAMQLHIKGEGYPPLLEEIFPPGHTYTLFQESPHIKSRPNKTNLYHEITYALALSAEENVTLEPRTILAFDPKKEKGYTLTIPKVTLNITPINPDKLLDTHDNPPPLAIEWGWLEAFIRYGVVFFAGYLFAHLWRWRQKKERLQNPLREKIRHAKNDQELLQLLLAEDVKRFASPIDKLEKRLYAQASIPFKEIQKEALERLS